MERPRNIAILLSMILTARRFAPHTYHRFDADGTRENVGGEYSRENVHSLRSLERTVSRKVQRQAAEHPDKPLAGTVVRITTLIINAVDDKGRTYGQTRRLESVAPRGPRPGEVTEDYMVRSVAPWGYRVFGHYATETEAVERAKEAWCPGLYIVVDHQMTEVVSRIQGTETTRSGAVAAASTVSVPPMSARRGAKAAPAVVAREVG